MKGNCSENSNKTIFPGIFMAWRPRRHRRHRHTLYCGWENTVCPLQETLSLGKVSRDNGHRLCEAGKGFSIIAGLTDFFFQGLNTETLRWALEGLIVGPRQAASNRSWQYDLLWTYCLAILHSMNCFVVFYRCAIGQETSGVKIIFRTAIWGS